MDNERKRGGVESFFTKKLEELLKEQGILNVNACIAYTENEDEYLTNGSMKFHEHMGYSLAGHFHKCGYKFDRWYDMIWMEKFIGEHEENQKILNISVSYKKWGCLKECRTHKTHPAAYVCTPSGAFYV